MPIPGLIFFGPTGSGKTELLEKLFGGGGGAEIVSADSMQVYRGLDIGTAKPNPALRERLPHHLIDIRNPDEQFTVGDFVMDADVSCKEIAGRGALPVISGGTGFYLKTFVLGLPETPPSDPRIRQELKTELSVRGAEALYAELQSLDPLSAERIHINDAYRLIRALEVCRLSGRPRSSFAVRGFKAPGGASRPEYTFLLIGLERNREDLYRRIDERCARMFREGLPEEVQNLFAAGYTPKHPGLRAIGYREFFEETQPGVYRLNPHREAVQALIARNSRRYAKRQITFFASLPEVFWVSAYTDPVKRIEERLARFSAFRGVGRLPPHPDDDQKPKIG
ncbi:MAG: tRNA (adenosine(37)-N6)-dimethylallyltransferase MiaA [Spirochaetaceae bacterium]|jgi:tRNA dimethylallyltransferase|nr:tRNA (adenosine(37)-N6)-dimethylallyltransferase MiaA [Spirochaetaceae bacterium]